MLTSLVFDNIAAFLSLLWHVQEAVNLYLIGKYVIQHLHGRDFIQDQGLRLAWGPGCWIDS